MPGLGVETDAGPHREIGGLFRTEIWWRDRYRDLEAHGYQLRPRYHPDWQPSWKRLGKDFFDTEDGQPTIVSSNGSSTSSPTTSPSYELRWMPYAWKMADK
jgi:hypothetical protein